MNGSKCHTPSLGTETWDRLVTIVYVPTYEMCVHATIQGLNVIFVCY